MAYTKAPMESTHGVQRVPVQGTSFLVSNLGSTPLWTPASNGYTNCFPISEPQWGTDPLRRVHTRQGWASAASSGTVVTGVNGKYLVQAYNNPLFFFAKTNTIYFINYLLNVVSTVTSGAVTDLYQYGWGTNATDNTNTNKIAILAAYNATNTYLHLCNDDGTSVSTTDLKSLSLTGEKGLVFINGYLFAVNTSGKSIYNSNPGGNLTTWNSTNFLDAEQYADNILWIDKHKNYLVAFGQASIEFFFDAAIEVGSPLKRQESYSSRIGLWNGWQSPPGQVVANVEDDLYFLGLSQQKQVGLYRIRNFQVEELDNQFIQGLMNDPNLGVSRVYACNFNNNPHIVVAFTNSDAWAYFIKENVWWKITGSDFPNYGAIIGIPANNVSSISGSNAPECFIVTSTGAATSVSLYSADSAYATSVTAIYRTEVIDLGNNRWKHLARVDAIGDFSTNTLTLAYNGTPNYGQSSTTTSPVQAANTIGYGNNISWFNLGAYRRFNFTLLMTGTQPCILEAFEVEYNVGNA